MRAFLPALALLVTLSSACNSIPPDPLQLNRGILTVDNRTSEDWVGVEVWLNQYYRVTVPLIAAGGRFQVPLDAFVSGYGQRFDDRHMMVNDLRLTAKDPAGRAVAIKKQFETSGLGALRGKT